MELSASDIRDSGGPHDISKSVPEADGRNGSGGRVPDRNPKGTSETYEQYYLRFVKASLKYAYPIGAALYVGYFLWDCLLAPSLDIRVRTFLLRASVSAMILVLWFLTPRVRSLKVVMLSVTGIYLATWLGLVAILRLLPEGLILGVTGLLLITMYCSTLFLGRAVPMTVCGLIGTATWAFASVDAAMTFQQIASGAIFLTSGVLVSGVFGILLDRELRQKYALERSLSAEKEQSETLLKEILPRYVIQRIREGAEIIADSMSEVNVIFIDIVDFTAMSRRLAPKHLLEVLGDLSARSTASAKCTALQRLRRSATHIWRRPERRSRRVTLPRPR